MKIWKARIYRVIFEADTPAGKLFDVVLLWSIVLSILVVFLESVPSLHFKYLTAFIIFEWTFTILFSIEFIFRLLSVPHPKKYVFSFMGIVDFLSILPAYLSLFITGSSYFIVIRILRLLRVFRIFKLTRYTKEARVLFMAMRASWPKISVFLGTVLSIIVIMGTVMYLIEGPKSGFDSIPLSVYWAIVTLTTVGYGDISPQTPLGQIIASAVMIMGYSILAVPTGIVSVEIAEAQRSIKNKEPANVCPNCLREGHDSDAVYCRFCGSILDPEKLE